LALLDLRHDFFRICAFIVLCAFVSNFLPDERRVAGYPKTRYVYRAFVDIIAGFGLNWRASLPSLDLEFMGFRVRRRRKIGGAE
jgi:hypothetical protein